MPIISSGENFHGWLKNREIREGFLPQKFMAYRSVPGKCPLLGKRPCTTFQGATVAASVQTYGISGL